MKKNNAISGVILFSLLCFSAFAVHSQDAPPLPTGLTAAAGDGQVTLSWDTPANTDQIDAWEYGVKEADGASYAWHAIPGSSGSTTSYTVSGLTNGTTYRFKVRAKNAGGVGPNSKRASATPATVPGLVGSLSAEAGDEQVVLSWAVPSSDGGSAITGYEYQYSPNGSGWQAVSDVSATVSGLKNGTAYTFEVRAVNSAGKGAASSTSATPVAPATVPGTVENLSATPGDGQVVLSWSAPSSDGGSAITGYEARLDGSTWEAVSGGADTRSQAVSGLTNGTEYTFEIRAVNSVGKGPASSTSATPATVPGLVGSLSAAAGDEQVVLSWAVPSSDGGSAITGYEYQYSPNGSGWTSVSGLTVTVSGLKNGTAYTFEVHAVNSVGKGAESSTSATPVGAPEVVANLSATPGDEQVTLSWDTPANTDQIDAWEYGIKEANGASYAWHAIPGSSGSTTRYTVSGLKNGTTYRFKIRAKNAIGVGPNSKRASATPMGAPEVVANLSAEAGDEQVTLSWDTPANTDQIDAWEYGIKEANGASYAWHAIPGSRGSTTRYTVSGLKNGTTYRFKIRAKNAIGVGPNSKRASATPMGAPEVVANLSAEAGDEQVVLSWDTPANTDQIDAWEYGIKEANGASYAWHAIPDSRGSTTRYTVSGLKNGTTYRFKIRAKNAIGVGPNSKRASATPVAPATVPGLVGSLSATPGDGQVVLSWDAPSSDGGSAITGYEYQYSPSGSGWTSVSDVNATVSGLNNGTEYTFEVRAVNGVGQGPASTASATPATVPGTVVNLSAAAGDGQVVLSWDAPSSDGGSAITGYEYQYSPSGSGWQAVSDVHATVSGLNNGTEYTFEIRAVNSVGKGAASSTSATPVAPATVPGTVVNLSATPGDGQVELGWDVPANDGGSAITGYEYQYSPSGSGWQAVSDVHATVSGLNNGTEYTFEVRAVNSVGQGPASAASATPATVPGTVVNLSAAAGDGQVVLSWAVPSSDGGSAITGYEYQYSPSGSGWTSVSDVNATVSGLNNGTEYTFEVRAVNSAGEGAASSTSATPVAPATVPGVVENLSAEAGDGQVVLSWAVPSSDGGSAITGYEYQYSPSGSGWTSVSDVNATVSGLNNGTEYTFEVRAVNGVGQGPASTASATPATVPGTVVNLSAEAGDGQVVLSWDAPSSDGGSAITGYEYQYSPGGSGWTSVSDVHATVSGLNNGTEYTFEIRAVNSVGKGAASSTSATPVAPATVPGTVVNLSATPGDGQVELGWDVPANDGGSAITGYEYQYSPSGSGWQAVSDVHATVSGLNNGTEYTFEVRAVNSVGQGPASTASATPATVPGTVVNLSAEAGDGQVVLSWDAPSSDGGSAITGYEYQYSPSGNGWQAVSDVHATVSGLNNGTEYTFEVRAVNGVGQGPASTASATPVAPATVPGTVVNLSAEAGDEQVVLSWAVPSSDGGSAITGYEYQYSPSGSGWTSVSDVNATVSGLNNGTEYTFEVRAVNGVGQGPASTASATPVAPATVPGTVVNLSAAAGDGQVVLSWDAPSSDGGSAITGYEYQYSPGGNGWQAVSDVNATVSGLNNGTEYTFEVRAVNGVGQGPASTASATPATVPGTVENLSAEAGDEQVVLSWAVPSSDGGSAITGYEYQYSPSGSGWQAVSDVNATVSGLNNGTEYTFEVRAVNGVGQGPASTASATPATVPGAVANLSAEAGDGQVVLSWAVPSSDGGSAITGYEYQYSPSGSGWQAVSDVSATVSGLNNGTEYTFEVRAVNSVGKGAASSTSATPIGAPGLVANLSATPGNEQVELGWAVPSSDGGSAITGYEYQYSPDGSGWTAVSDTTVTVSGLNNGTEYTFEVRAVNSMGQGPASTASATPATVPGTVENLSATPGDIQITLRWQPPTDDGGAPITGYEYRWAGTWIAVEAGADTLEVTVRGLGNGGQYYFLVRAINSMGAGPFVGIFGTPGTVPGKVARLSATPGNGQVELRWDAPASDGGAAITKYQYRYSSTTHGTWTPSQPIWAPVSAGADTLEVTVSGLVNGTAYTFEIRAVNPAGEGPASSVPATPTATVPGTVVRLSATPGDRQVTLGWQPPTDDGGAEVTGYEYRLDGGSWQDVSGEASARRVTVSGLTNGTAYTFEIRAVNRVGEGPASSVPATPTATVPGTVVRLSATPGDRQVTLRWQPPTDDGGPPITKYQYRLDGGSWQDVSGEASARRVTVSGLVNGTAYTFEVRAVNRAGEGAASSKSATPMDMIAHYLFNGNALDASGSRYHGTLSGPGSTSDRFGNKAGAILFNGTNHRINLPRAVLNGRTNVSVAFWLKTSFTTRAQSIISGANYPNQNEYLIYLLNQNTLSFYSHGSGVGPGLNEGRCDVTIPSIADGYWHHIAVIRNDSQGHTDIYVDGTGYTNRCRSLSYNRLVIARGGLIIGQEQDRVGGGFDSNQILRGALDDLRIYGKVLSASEVQALSRERNPKTVPGAVANLSATPRDGQVVLSWDAPASDGGSPITGYEYQYSPGGSGWTAVSDKSATVSGLNNGTAYTFSVRAVNAVGNGAASSKSATPAPATVPGAVANLSVTPGDGKVVLGWDAPSSDGFSPITGYQYQYSPGGSGWTAVSDKSATVSGLNNGTQYTFSVRAVNAVGNGAASSKSATPMDMIAHYLFNGNARDASGNGYHGTLSGPGSTSDRFGNKASAILFNGTNHRINLPRAVLNGRTNVSVAFWLKTSKTGTQSIISGANRNNENEYLIFFLNQSTLSFYSHGAGPGVNEGRCDVTIPSIADGSWHHIAVIRNDSQGRADIYVDGTGYTNRCRNLVYNRLVIDSGGLIIGQEQDRVGGGFDSTQILKGALDDLRIYGKVLSASEVQALSRERNPKAVATREEPATSGLALNFPNPFNAGTQITYHLATSGPVRLEIYNALGQPVKTLVEEFQTVGSYQIHWDARDQRGAAVATGVYFTRLLYPGGVQVRRLLYLK